MSDIEKQHNSIFEQIRRIDENGNIQNIVILFR